jgi:glycosyltransferase involved in cell wall biosynthesis
MLALSFGRPVIAPAIGSLKDLIVQRCGILYDPSQPDGLRNAMLAAAKTAFDEHQILQQAATRSWDKSAKIVLETLQCRL